MDQNLLSLETEETPVQFLFFILTKQIPCFIAAPPSIHTQISYIFTLEGKNQESVHEASACQHQNIHSYQGVFQGR